MTLTNYALTSLFKSCMRTAFWDREETLKSGSSSDSFVSIIIYVKCNKRLFKTVIHFTCYRVY